MSETGSACQSVVVGTRAVARAADLPVVGNTGLAGIEGRLRGSVPADATRRSECGALVVHTAG